MSIPKGQHFLPRRAYLRFFCVPGTERLYLYRRGATPVLTNISNVAKQNGLYSFETAVGEVNHDLETRFFAQLDGAATPIFEKLNGATDRAVQITNDEIDTLLQYIAIQFVRTPTFKEMRMRNSLSVTEAASTLTDLQMTELRQKLPPGLIPDGVAESDSELAALWREAMEEVKPYFIDKRSWLSQMGRFAEGIAGSLSSRRVELELLRVDDEILITCDQPVLIDYAQNFATSDVYFPVGSTAALFFGSTHSRRRVSSPPAIPISKLSAAKARAFNRGIVSSAEDELYAAVNRDGIRNLFDKAPRPKRFTAPSVVEILGLRKAALTSK